MTDWRQTKKGNFIVNGASNHSPQPRQKADYYATDPKAIDYLLQHEQFAPQIWECACGGGNLSKRLEQHGYEVMSTDKYDRGYGIFNIDFLKQTTKFEGDIITNPPYKYATEFVLKALELTNRKVAMFLKIQFLESQGRWEKIFSKYPPSKVYVFVKRIKCYPNNVDTVKSSAVCYAWFIWDKEHKGKTEVEWLHENKSINKDT